MMTDVFGKVDVIFLFGIVLLLGYVSGRIANFFKLPKVTGYIAAGILMEPSITGILPARLIAHSPVLSNLALCIITYAIGGSLDLRHIKKQGKTIGIMTVFEAEMTFLIIMLGMWLLLPILGKLTNMQLDPKFFLPLAILAGALGAPTDPTPTLAVKEEYKADGPVMTTILGIGALDDAFGIINFSVAVAICGALVGGNTGVGFMEVLMGAGVQIVVSVVVGVICAGVLLLVSRRTEDKGVIVVLIMGTLFTCYGISEGLGGDSLLSTMTMGMVAVNFSRDADRLFMSIRDYFEEFVFVVFFVLAGANLQLGVLLTALPIVIVFVVLRVAGKIIGAGTGAIIGGAEPSVKKYTAYGLIPQGGIVVGLALLVEQNGAFKPFAPVLLNTILGTTVLFEFLGPYFTEVALKKAGEVGKKA
ncbi:MAG: cation:proton antiporter [Candidatus Omnitrophica bacterium]|nr:cation:proton antiporter [Candidatus Omnitrophota bacterium]MDD5488257.1 cation:proton antiporter [Candidatus Omnitrophota bacterium]